MPTDETPPQNPYSWSPSQLPTPVPQPRKPRNKRGGILGIFVAVGAAVLKYGFLALKLFKFTTLFSALITYVFLLSIYGWQFALGIIILVVIHEFGHMVAATKEGLPVTAPIFALLGAFVRTPSRNDPRQDAFIAISGPAAGLLAACGAGALSAAATSSSTKGLFFALMSFGCLITIFNMLPMGFLDGGKIARVLPSRILYSAGVVLIGLFLSISGGGIVLIVGVVCLYIGFRHRREQRATAPGIANVYLVLIVLASLGLILANNAAIQNGLHY
jgi:Zn-dependent protease